MRQGIKLFQAGHFRLESCSIFISNPTAVKVEVVLVLSLGFDKKLVPIWIKYRDLSSKNKYHGISIIDCLQVLYTSPGNRVPILTIIFIHSYLIFYTLNTFLVGDDQN